jgi:hypothetical protein
MRNRLKLVGFEVFTTVSMQTRVFNAVQGKRKDTDSGEIKRKKGRNKVWEQIEKGWKVKEEC